MRRTAKQAFSEYINTGKKNGAFMVNDQQAFINSSPELTKTLNQVIYIISGTWKIESCDAVTITPSHLILDDTTWKSKLFNSPTPSHQKYRYPDNIGYAVTTIGMPVGFFQQFYTSARWVSPSITFVRGGQTPIGKQWPFNDD